MEMEGKPKIMGKMNVAHFNNQKCKKKKRKKIFKQ